MSRTIKDIPYRVLAEHAYDKGYIDHSRGIRFHAYQDTVSFSIAIDDSNDALKNDWMAWVNLIREHFTVISSIQRHVKNHYSIPVVDDEPISGIQYERVWTWHGSGFGGTSSYDQKFIDFLNEECNPYSFALDIKQSLRNVDYVDVMTCKVIMNTRSRSDAYEIMRNADVNAYIAYKGSGDRHYKYGMKSYLSKHEDIYVSRASVRDELVKARNAYNSGEDMDDYDSPDIYQNKPEVEWWY
jgi:hypothetical protein